MGRPARARPTDVAVLAAGPVVEHLELDGLHPPQTVFRLADRARRLTPALERIAAVAA